MGKNWILLIIPIYAKVSNYKTLNSTNKCKTFHRVCDYEQLPTPKRRI
ncbi:Low molecular weight protein tyrosine phosphatase [bacterium endosymbiont of Bathymodiolus sp. 5 South]|nr:Low molecular weight protein tyrosine phosphatase (EC 3.1.3.48) [uncultured Gammaproteobacteria bacterium]SSC08133.1 Low molecular weight protein tyrosine phosphatase [bacterium endosymbiont of Bathymodiolus sp. 5 South]